MDTDKRGVSVAKHDSLPGVDALVLSSMQQHLQQFASAIPGIKSAVIASVDGFAIAQVTGRENQADRLAAMTSSMLALGAAIGRELSLGTLEVLIIEAGDGKVLMLSIPAPQRPLLLMAACNQRSVIGNVLWSARECGQKILRDLGGP